MRHPRPAPRPHPDDDAGGISTEWLATAVLAVAVLAALGTGAVAERLGGALANAWCRTTASFGPVDCGAPTRVSAAAVPRVPVAHAAVGGDDTTTTTPVTADELPRPPEAPPLPDGSLAELVGRLEVDDGPPPGGYDRRRFSHWDRTGDGCNVRHAVLRRDFSGFELSDDGCQPVAGTGELRSLWDGEVVDDPSQVDIDHVRSLSEAWDAGASTWSDEDRRRFANDPANLVAVTRSSNRSKGSSGPDTWLPDAGEDATCSYLTTWTQVTIAYELTVSTAELDVVAEHTDVC